MGFNEWLLVAATLSGPVLAVQAQKWIEHTARLAISGFGYSERLWRRGAHA